MLTNKCCRCPAGPHTRSCRRLYCQSELRPSRRHPWRGLSRRSRSPHRSLAESRTRRHPQGSRSSPGHRRKQRRRSWNRPSAPELLAILPARAPLKPVASVARSVSQISMHASLSSGVQDTSLPEPAAPVARRASQASMPASFTGGAQGTSPPTWFASKPRAPKETAETLFENRRGRPCRCSDGASR